MTLISRKHTESRHWCGTQVGLQLLLYFKPCALQGLVANDGI